MSDLISRSELKKAIKEIFDTVDVLLFDDIIATINNAPTVPLPDFKEGYKQAIRDGKTNFSRPQGEWINREAVSNTTFPFWERYECNQCHKFNGYSNFCPNCGADMRREANE